ncbi:MAG TPA: phosphatase PAP2 family protein [Patescibacteria group bacterium]|nr:phosphatase PAP2 family protein [Patescibacteria group bacterium]
MTLDHNLFLTINGWAGHSAILDKIGTFVGGDYFLYLFGLAVILLWFNKRLRKNVYLAIVSGILARGIIAEVLKRLVHRPRPFQVLKVHQLIVDNEAGNSFPSGHAVAYFVFAFAFLGTEYFWPFFVAACIGSLGRVFVGVHYPLDVIAGAIIGAAITWIIQKSFKYFSKPN